MPRKKKKLNSKQKPDVKRLVERLVKQEFGDYLLGIRFDGPYEDEDLDIDLLFKEEPSDVPERWNRIDHELDKAGLVVLYNWDTWNELEEDEKRDWQCLWQPVNVKKPKTKAKGVKRNVDVV